MSTDNLGHPEGRFSLETAYVAIMPCFLVVDVVFVGMHEKMRNAHHRNIEAVLTSTNDLCLREKKNA